MSKTTFTINPLLVHYGKRILEDSPNPKIDVFIFSLVQYLSMWKGRHKGWSMIPYTSIAKKARVSVTTLKQSIDRLVHSGIVERDYSQKVRLPNSPQHYKHSVLYRIWMPPAEHDKPFYDYKVTRFGQEIINNPERDIVAEVFVFFWLQIYSDFNKGWSRLGINQLSKTGRMRKGRVKEAIRNLVDWETLEEDEGWYRITSDGVMPGMRDSKVIFHRSMLERTPAVSKDDGSPVALALFYSTENALQPSEIPLDLVPMFDFRCITCGTHFNRYTLEPFEGSSVQSTEFCPRCLSSLKNLGKFELHVQDIFMGVFDAELL